MASYLVKESKGQTLSGVAIVLVIAAILLVVIGVSTESFGAAVFGAVLLGLAILVGIVGMGIHAFRR
jgi:Na+-transporting methylmalonyl-CoA/oxaloacetate decarboxylase gamma subunit